MSHARPSSSNQTYRSLDAIQVGLAHVRAAPVELIGPLPGRPRLAIIGSRAAHRRVLGTLRSLVEAAGRRGWSLVSGGAIGVDGAAHQAALELGVPQLAVLPCGRDTFYPPGNARLFRAMLAAPEAGLAFAYPPGTRSTRQMFFTRNQIVVGLADAVLVAEASLRSGSRGTGDLARSRGRPLAAIAGSSGCAALIGAGAVGLPCPPTRDDPEQLRELVDGLDAWLDRLSGRADAGPNPDDDPDQDPDQDPKEDPWPARLLWLAKLLVDAGPAGANLDALPDPDAAFVALTEAEFLGLACEASPGRWVARVPPAAKPDTCA